MLSLCNRYKLKLIGVLSSIAVSIISLSGCGLSQEAAPHRVDGQITYKAESLLQMADSFLKAGDYNGALRLYQRAARENPKDLTSRIGLATTYQKLGAINQAAYYFKEILKVNPEHVPSKLGLGQIYIRKNDPKQALLYLEESEKTSIENYKFYNSKGLAYDLNGEHMKAQIAYGAGLNLAPNNISLLNNLALSYGIAGDYAPSIQIFGKAINLDNTKTTARYNLVMIYVLSGEVDDARKMASSLMEPEEIVKSFKHYKWIKGLSSVERAQAIFLNKTKFRGEEPVTVGKILSATTSKTISLPMTEKLNEQQKKLNEILASEEERTAVKDENTPIIDKKISSGEASIKENLPTPLVKSVQNIESKLEKTVGYYVQLISCLNEGCSYKYWDVINKKEEVSDLLTSFDPIIKKITLDDMDYFHLYIGSFKTIKQAKALCSELKKENIQCHSTNLK